LNIIVNLKEPHPSGSYERTEFEIMKHLVGFGNTVIDVGANEGYISLWISKKAGKDGSVFAIEPNPENLVFLHSNVRLNRAANIQVIEKAISDQKGRVHFFCSPGSGAWGSLIHCSWFSNNGIEVQVDTLDGLFGSLKQIDLIKIDTEGNELKVLLGAHGLLERHTPHICFEVNLTFWAHDDQSVDTLFKYLYGLGYELFVPNGTTLCRYEWLSERIMNLFAVHSTKVPGLADRGIISTRSVA
jgi:FkbM family methyltransferase